MPDSLQQVAFAVGSAVVRPGLGSAELLLGLVIACGFALSAVHGLVAGRHGHTLR